jgi:hypothetical protein
VRAQGIKQVTTVDELKKGVGCWKQIDRSGAFRAVSYETTSSSGRTVSSATHGAGAEGRADAALSAKHLQGKRQLFVREVPRMLQPQL